MNKYIIDILGYIAAMLTTFAFLPQSIKTLRLKKTDDLSSAMCILFCTGVLLWLIYGIFITNIPLIIANSITLIFATIILVVKIRFDWLRTPRKSIKQEKIIIN